MMIRLLDENDKILEVFNLQFNRKNVNKIAYNYDAKVVDFNKGMATLKDSQGRLLFADEVSKRFMKKLSETTWSAYNYPDDGRGVCTDDDRPPGNILIGTKMKPIDFFNKLTTFARNWDYDSGDWTWDDFENAGGMEDYDNYHQSLQAMKPLFSKEKWKSIWKRMRQVPDAQTAKDFDKAGQPWRTSKTQLGRDKVDVALPPEEIQSEELIKRIDMLIL